MRILSSIKKRCSNSLCLSAAVFISGCASYPYTTSLAPEGISFIEEKQGGAIVYNAQSDTDCNEMTVSFVNQETGERFRTKTWLRTQNLPYDGSELAFAWVPVGDYVIANGTCEQAGYLRSDLIGFNETFSSISIASGDLKYIGTLDIAQHKPEGVQTFSTLTLLKYGIEDHSSSIEAYIALTYPSVADNFTVELMTKTR